MAANNQPGYTYNQQACTIVQGCHIVIDGRPCKVIEVTYKESSCRSYTNCTYVAYDIFNGNKHTHTARSDQDCVVPIVCDKFYKILRIYSDGRLLLKTECGLKMDGFILPPGPNGPPPNPGDGDYLTRTKHKFGSGIQMYVTVKSAMGLECINGVMETRRVS